MKENRQNYAACAELIIYLNRFGFLIQIFEKHGGIWNCSIGKGQYKSAVIFTSSEIKKAVYVIMHGDGKKMAPPEGLEPPT